MEVVERETTGIVSKDNFQGSSNGSWHVLNLESLTSKVENSIGVILESSSLKNADAAIAEPSELVMLESDDASEDGSRPLVIDESGPESELQDQEHQDEGISVKHSCSKCGISFSEHRNIINHLVYNHTKSSFQCELCSYQPTSRISLLRHRLDQHSTAYPTLKIDISSVFEKSDRSLSWYLCLICNYKSWYKDNIIHHLIEEHSYKVLSCNECDFQSTEKSIVEKHRQEAHIVVNLDSDSEADSSCESSTKKTKHSTPQGSGLHECDRCNYKTTILVNLMRHTYSVHRRIWVDENLAPEGRQVGPKPCSFFCNFCSFKTDDKNTLYKHKEMIHQDGKVFLCALCKFRSNSLSELNKHMLSIHANHSPYLCLKCFFKGKNEKDFKDHILECQAKFVCPKCKFSSSSENSLKQHLAQHDNSTNLCLLCEYKAVNESDLYHHMMASHSSANSFSCNICKFSTNSVQDFYQHEFLCHKSNFKCQVCDFATNKKVDLEAHMNKFHSSLKFACHKCTYRTKIKIELTQHLQKEHGYNHVGNDSLAKLDKVILGKVYSCTFCGFKTIGAQELTNHMEGSHLYLWQLNFSKIIDRRSIPYYACNNCEYRSTNKADLSSHLNMHVIEGTHTPSKCPNTISVEVIELEDTESVDQSNNTILKDNIGVHECSNQNYSFKTKENEIMKTFKNNNVNSNNDQSNAKNNIKEYFCRGCNFKTLEEKELYPHVLKVHINSLQYKKAKLFCCSMCDFMSDQEADLKTHSLRHHMEKISANYESTTIKVNDEIITLDDNEDVHSCDLCKFKTTDKNDFKTHQLQQHQIPYNQTAVQDVCEIITVDDDEDSMNETSSINDDMKMFHNVEEEFKINPDSIDINLDSVSDLNLIKTETNDSISCPCKHCVFVGKSKIDCIKHMRIRHPSILIHQEKESMDNYLGIKQEISDDKNQAVVAYSCGLCAFKTSEGKHLGAHVEAFHPLDSSTSTEYTENREDLQFYEIKTEGGVISDIYPCTICQFTAHAVRELNIHIISVHWKETVLYCLNCEYVTNKEEVLQEHVKLCRKGSFIYICYICNYQAGHMKNLQKHLTNCHKDETNFNCSYCNFKAKETLNLMFHINEVHEDNTPHFCHFCSYETKSLRQLFSHLNSLHPNSQRFCCNLCNYRTGKLGDLISHVSKFHKDKKLLICEICNYRTGYKSILRKHILSKHAMETFNKEKSRSDKKLNNYDFSCKYCNYQVKNRLTLKRHEQNVHRKLKLVYCDHCSFETTKNRVLKRHITSVHKIK